MILVFDIETGISNDADKFKPKFIADARLKYVDKIKQDLAIKYSTWEKDCALRALTGEILAIGYKDKEMITGDYMIGGLSEKLLIKGFWDWYNLTLKNGHTICGHNIKGFDLPFLWRRSLKYGIKPLWNPSDRYNAQIVDTMELWSCNQYPKEFISLDNLAKFLNVGEKNGEGKDFAKLFKNPDTKQQAMEYLQNDLELTYKVAEKIINK